MHKTQIRLPTSEYIDRMRLVQLRLKAIRAGVWFKALRRIDRVLVDLTMKVTQTVRSPSLARSILTVTRKLEELLEGRLARAMREFGFPLASKLSGFAQKWGNNEASTWRDNAGFARYLSVMDLNG